MKTAYKIGLVAGAAMLMMLMPARGRAEQLEKFDGYIVHYNALSADQLAPEVAQAYKLQRSSHRGLVNIAVQKDNGAAEPTPVGATITGTASNLSGQRTPLDIREIKEDGAVYYLGEFPIGSGTDTFRFQIDVKPEGATRAYALKFSKNYVTD